MLFADGTVGPNPYGADPKNRMPYQAQPASVNVTVNVSREEVKVDKPVEDAPAPAEAPAEENKEKLNNLIKEEIESLLQNSYCRRFLLLICLLFNILYKFVE